MLWQDLREPVCCEGGLGYVSHRLDKAWVLVQESLNLEMKGPSVGLTHRGGAVLEVLQVGEDPLLPQPLVALQVEHLHTIARLSHSIRL